MPRRIWGISESISLPVFLWFLGLNLLEIVHALQDKDDDDDISLECDTLLNLIDDLQDSVAEEDINGHLDIFNDIYKQVKCHSLLNSLR